MSRIKDTINREQDLQLNDIKKIKDFDDKNSLNSDSSDKLAEVSDEEILNAVKTLKKAGLNLTLQSDNPYQIMQYQDPRMIEMSMLLGNNNNYNNQRK